MNKKVLVTLATRDYAEMLSMSRLTFQKYSEKWGYDYLEITETLDASRPDAWSKLLAIRSLLEKYEFVLYVDSDAIILKYDEDLEQQIKPQEEFAWALCRYNGGRTCPNAGVIGIRSNEKTKLLIEQAYGQTDLIHNGWWEQAALMRILQYDEVRAGELGWENYNLPNLDIQVCELTPKWNSMILDFESEPTIRHFAGDPLNVKMMFMADYLLRNIEFLESTTGHFKNEILKIYVKSKNQISENEQSIFGRFRLKFLRLLLKFRLIRQIKWR